MKLAVVPLPNGKSCEFVLKDGEVAPPIFFINRNKQFVVLGALLLCSIALVYSSVAPNRPARKAAADSQNRRMEQFNGSRPLKAGELVIVTGNGAAQVRRVAAPPKEAVLLRQGNALRGLYMAGEKSYVLISGNETRIVPTHQIQAVIRPVL